MSGLASIDTQTLSDALRAIGADPQARTAILHALTAWESRSQTDGDDIRERVTGPLVDALHADVEAVERKLTSGLNFRLPYRSKIAREFAMGVEPAEHVWEPQTTRLLLLLAKDAKTIVVGGAYAGDHAVPMAHVIRERGKVHCFEVNPLEVQALRDNAARNGLNNVVINGIGLWDTPGFIEMVGEDSHATPVAVAQQTADSFPVTTIEGYADEKGIETIDLVMLDVEGAEERILSGMRRFLKQPTAPDIVFEVHRTYVDWSNGLENSEIVRLLTSNGYTVFAIRDYQGNVDMSGRPVELIPAEAAYLQGPPHGFNMFATKHPDKVERIGLKIRKDVSPKLLRHRLSPLHQP